MAFWTERDFVVRVVNGDKQLVIGTLTEVGTVIEFGSLIGLEMDDNQGEFRFSEYSGTASNIYTHRYLDRVFQTWI